MLYTWGIGVIGVLVMVMMARGYHDEGHYRRNEGPSMQSQQLAGWQVKYSTCFPPLPPPAVNHKGTRKTPI